MTPLVAGISLSRVSFETSFNSKQPKLVSSLSETKRLFRLFHFYTETESFDISIEPKQTEDQPKKFDREYILVFLWKVTVVLVCFGWFRNSSDCFNRFDICRFETPKQTEIFWFGFHETNRNRSCFGLFRFEPKFFFCFEDTLSLRMVPVGPPHSPFTFTGLPGADRDRTMRAPPAPIAHAQCCQLIVRNLRRFFGLVPRVYTSFSSGYSSGRAFSISLEYLITEFLPWAGRGGLAKIAQELTFKRFNKYPRYKSIWGRFVPGVKPTQGKVKIL
jgi:hypothetical protein